MVEELKRAGIRVSLFIAAEPAQIEAAAALGAPVIEIHTGSWCEAVTDRGKGSRRADAEWQRIVEGARLARSLGLEVHAGHGLDYDTARTIAALPEIVELNIGHFLIGDAVFGGLAHAVKTMRTDDGQRARCRGSRMILGIGSDITDVRRIAKVIDRHGERFLDRVFTATERARAERKKDRIETYAKRFAAKEACAKALGTGMRGGVWWRDMGVVNLPSGRPTMQLTGGALHRLQALTPARLRGPHRPHHHRRGADGAGFRRDLRGAARMSWEIRKRCRG